MKKIPVPIVLAFSLFIFAGCTNTPKNTPASAPVQSNAKDAPEINTNYGWLNTDRSYSIKDFQGKIVLLDFWTFGCINCQHIIPDLEKLEMEFPNELVVIGIHSAKFDSEKSSDRIRNAISKFGITHPVVNDADYAVWHSYNINSWPTVTLVTPDGKIFFQREGERVYDVFRQKIMQLKEEYKGRLKEQPFAFHAKKDTVSSILKFPSKLIAGEKGTVWLSDSGNDRILNIDENGKILETIGKGSQGFENGGFSSATFYEPQGLALDGDRLYIADSKNNSIRVADLTTRQVSTIAGDGTMGYYYNNDKLNTPVLPNTPWDLLLDNGFLFIANAGNHQLLRMNVSDNKVFRFAGNGREALKNGSLIEASFNQPSGLAKDKDFLYVADPEASAIRKVDLKNKLVQTLVGKGLFKFGDKDGALDQALLQHCVGLAVDNEKIYIADTYNGKVKVLDLSKMRLTTLVDGLNEPNDVLLKGNNLWITDTNNNQLVIFDLKNKKKTIVQVRV
ncbi:MAG TPA: thioredoxin-like domain-containing protein [Chitinophagaceae bacterium]|nr:thioredoxin-like domain-containing protein [Chitinophagaceae bacterium]